MLHGIVKQVDDHLGNHPGIHIRHDNLLWQRYLEIPPVPQADHVKGCFINHIINDFRTLIDKLLPALDLRHAQDILHHLHQPHRLLHNILYQLGALRRIHILGFQDQPAVAHDPG